MSEVVRNFRVVSSEISFALQGRAEQDRGYS